jgi:hypothetical protein
MNQPFPLTIIIFGLSLLGFNISLNAKDFVDIGRFTEPTKTLEPWQIARFDKKIPATEFQWIHWQGYTALEAKANNSMALMARPVEIDLEKYPILCWQWWVDDTIEKADLNTKQGDDYAARLYLTFKLPEELISWGLSVKLSLARSIYGDQVPEAAINYVWDNKHPIGTSKPNAYTEQAQMMVLQSGNTLSKQWVKQQRNVLQDLTQLFKAPKAKLIQIALASDGDNTHSQARALFTDLHFVTENGSCQWSQTTDPVSQ